MSFGKRLQGYRKEKGLSQEALANQLYVTRQSISQWENDKTMPSVDLLLKISEIFGVTVDELLGRPETESIPQPVGQENILRDKKDIIEAMRYELSEVKVVLFSLSLGFFGLFLLEWFICANIFTPEVSRLRKLDLGSEQVLFLSAVCLIAGIVFTVIARVRTHKTVQFAKNHPCHLQFYFDHMVIAEEGTQPLSLFYANVKRIVETDCYFIFKMQNKARLCVKKGDNARELSVLLKSSGNYLNRSLYKTNPCPSGRVKRCLIRWFRDYLFITAIFFASINGLIFAVLTTIVTHAQALRVAIRLTPFLIAAAVIACGIVFTVRHIKAKRMIITGGAVLIVLALGFAVSNLGAVYNWQNERVTAEAFSDYMESHGMTVENTIRGREETFISSCLTAHPDNNAYEVLYMEFDEYSSGYGLVSALEAYGKLYGQVRSQPCQYMWMKTENLGNNAFYIEETNNYFSIVSLNEYSVIYVSTAVEKKDAVQELLRDWELPKPY